MLYLNPRLNDHEYVCMRLCHWWGCGSLILSMIDDEFDVKIIDEIVMDYGEISVVYINDYANMKLRQICFWINGFWGQIVGDMYEGLEMKGVGVVWWKLEFLKKISSAIDCMPSKSEKISNAIDCRGIQSNVMPGNVIFMKSVEKHVSVTIDCHRSNGENFRVCFCYVVRRFWMYLLICRSEWHVVWSLAS